MIRLEIAQIYSEEGNTKLAEDLLLSSLEILEEVKNKAGISTACQLLGKLNWEEGNQKNAIQYLEKSYQLALELRYPRYIKEPAEMLYIIYKSKGNAVDALKMHEVFHAMNDSIERDEGRELLRKQKDQFDAYKEQLELEQVKENKRHLEEQRIERRNT